MTNRQREPTPSEMVILALIAEQNAIPLDQLARFLQVDTPSAAEIAEELHGKGLVQMRDLIEGDAPWIWLLSRGARFSETGFRATKPAISRLAHTRAINEARLVIAERSPKVRWVCERTLRKTYDPEGKIPDALAIEGDARCAVEVEITPKTAMRTRQIIAEHSARYDAIVYFCSPQALTLLKRVKEELGNPKLFVQALPGWSSSSPKPKRSKSAEVISPRRGEPKPEEVPVLDLISEQGAIPVDQLARFLNYTPNKAKQLAKRLHEEGLVRREKLLAQEPEWLWLTKRGARFSNRDLSAPRLKIGSLALIRATNDVRIVISKNAPNVYWISRRLLLHEWGRNAPVPRSVVKTGQEHHAIEVRLAPTEDQRMEKLVSRRLAEYDALVCFCTPTAKRQLERLAKQNHWRRLQILDLPRAT